MVAICAVGMNPFATAFDREADGDDDQQRDDKGFQLTEAALVEHQDQQHVGGGDADTEHERDAEQKLQGDGRADHLGQVAGDDRHLAHQPQEDTDRPAVMLATGLRQVQPGNDAEPGGERLQQHRHQIGKEND